MLIFGFSNLKRISCDNIKELTSYVIFVI